MTVRVQLTSRPDPFQRAVPEASRLQVAIGGHTEAGAKAENQDAFAARVPTDSAERHARGIVACVADGLSSAARAREASQLAVTQFIDDYYAASPAWSAREAGTRSLAALNSWCHAQGSAGAMATAFTGLVIRSRTAHIFNIGDSRAYLYRTGRLRQLTRDHSLPGAGGAVLTAALGAEPHLSLTYNTIELDPGDVFLLTSDGLPSIMPAAAIADALSEIGLPTDLEALACKLSGDARAAGADDNLTVLLLRVDELPDASYGEHQSRFGSRACLPRLRLGESVDDYKVERLLHDGVRSHVYRVRHNATGEVRVLKAPTERVADDPELLEAIAREEWIGQNTPTEAALTTYPAGDTQFLYVLSEWVQGPTLRQWMTDNEAPAIHVVRDILHDLISAIRPLHRQGIVHRDLKPENVILRAEGGIKIIDFGSASIAGLEEISPWARTWKGEGSLNYSAPEYIMGDPATARSDLFSVACITYEMLTGELPYKRDIGAHSTPSKLSAWSYISARRRRTDLPPFIDAALEAALSPDPARRTSSFSEFEADMKRPGTLAKRRASSTALIERDPLRFWQWVAAFQLLVILALLAALSG